MLSRSTNDSTTSAWSQSSRSTDLSSSKSRDRRNILTSTLQMVNALYPQGQAPLDLGDPDNDSWHDSTSESGTSKLLRIASNRSQSPTALLDQEASSASLWTEGSTSISGTGVSSNLNSALKWSPEHQDVGESSASLWTEGSTSISGITTSIRLTHDLETSNHSRWTEGSTTTTTASLTATPRQILGFSSSFPWASSSSPPSRANIMDTPMGGASISSPWTSSSSQSRPKIEAHKVELSTSYRLRKIAEGEMIESSSSHWTSSSSPPRLTLNGEGHQAEASISSHWTTSSQSLAKHKEGKEVTTNSSSPWTKSPTQSRMQKLRLKSLHALPDNNNNNSSHTVRSTSPSRGTNVGSSSNGYYADNSASTQDDESENDDESDSFSLGNVSAESGTLWVLLKMVNEQQDVIARYREDTMQLKTENAELKLQIRKLQNKQEENGQMLTEALATLESQRKLLFDVLDQHAKLKQELRDSRSTPPLSMVDNLERLTLDENEDRVPSPYDLFLTKRARTFDWEEPVTSSLQLPSQTNAKKPSLTTKNAHAEPSRKSSELQEATRKRAPPVLSQALVPLAKVGEAHEANRKRTPSTQGENVASAASPLGEGQEITRKRTPSALRENLSSASKLAEGQEIPRKRTPSAIRENLAASTSKPAEGQEIPRKLTPSAVRENLAAASKPAEGIEIARKRTPSAIREKMGYSSKSVDSQELVRKRPPPQSAENLAAAPIKSKGSQDAQRKRPPPTLEQQDRSNSNSKSSVQGILKKPSLGDQKQRLSSTLENQESPRKKTSSLATAPTNVSIVKGKDFETLDPAKRKSAVGMEIVLREDTPERNPSTKDQVPPSPSSSYEEPTKPETKQTHKEPTRITKTDDRGPTFKETSRRSGSARRAFSVQSGIERNQAIRDRFQLDKEGFQFDAEVLKSPKKVNSFRAAKALSGPAPPSYFGLESFGVPPVQTITLDPPGAHLSADETPFSIILDCHQTVTSTLSASYVRDLVAPIPTRIHHGDQKPASKVDPPVAIVRQAGRGQGPWFRPLQDQSSSASSGKEHRRRSMPSFH